jgi:hypothetical protein
MITGGSNYVNINGSYDNPVIGTYHRFPEVVEANLNAMFEHGQRKITLVCWYAPLTFPAAHEHLWGHIVDSFGGVMFEQHQQNLIDLLALIRAIGFNQINFRFGATATAYVTQWEQWNPPQFNENWSFVNSVRNLILANTDLKVVFDLQVESANSELATNPLRELYARRLWRLYTTEHGTEDSCGYSVIHGVDGLQAMWRAFDIGHLPRPACYCFDVYDREYLVLTTASDALTAAGEIEKPVYIQETNYNDAQSYADIKLALSEKPLNFQCIFQWPKVRDQPDVFPDVFPKRFDNYLVEE